MDDLFALAKAVLMLRSTAPGLLQGARCDLQRAFCTWYLVLYSVEFKGARAHRIGNYR
jgi:hypothetical protein